MRLGKSVILLTIPLSLPATAARAQTASPMTAQTTQLTATIDLTLDEAIRRGIDQSEEVRLARADIEQAETRIVAARAPGLPQVNASGNFNRLYQSELSGGNLQFQLPPELRFNPDPTAPLPDRVSYLEQNADKAVLTTLADLIAVAFQDVGISSPNMYRVNLTGSQLLYGGGRVRASVAIAENVRDAARLNYREEAAEVELLVRTAYFRALLAQELATISEAAIVQAESFLSQERLRLQAGFASELDVIRAEVSLENLRPQLVDARNALDLSMFNLKRLVKYPLQQPVRLSTPLEVPTAAALAEPRLDPEQLVRERAAVQAADRQVAAREFQVQATRGAYRPQVSLQASYGGYIIPDRFYDFRNASWTPLGSLMVGVQVPIFTGFQRGADIGQAQVLLQQTRLQNTQLRESVQLQYEQALAERERARATIAARQRTVDQAQRVYDLMVLRYDQGQATQLDVSNSRLELLQARTNLAQALSDFYITSAAVMRATGMTTVPLPAPNPPPDEPLWSALGFGGRASAGSQ
jgi:outer membrane protein TolC